MTATPSPLEHDTYDTMGDHDTYVALPKYYDESGQGTAHAEPDRANSEPLA
jgi:hypothetical protein